MKIGNVEIKKAAALAPMAGVADRAFRELCVQNGAAYVVSEMVSSKGISMHDRKSSELMYISPDEHPAAVQIFGCEPETMAQAAVRALDYKPDIIDINMGCPAPKVASSGGGATLMKSPVLAGKIVEACVRAVDIPVTVKIRSGWDDESINAVEVAKICENSGAAAVTVHGRTRNQMYAPQVNTEIIRLVKESVSIPVIGNGDIEDGPSAVKMMKDTDCDMVMVGRGALGRPWVFGQINTFIETGEVIPEPPVEERMEVMLRHIETLCEYKGVRIGIREARKHAAWYMKGMHGAAQFRNEACRIESIDELKRLVERILKIAK